jgi:methionyl-tRNA synthetase
MSEHIGVFVAWPYASGDLHLGHVAGAYLPPDIFARYHRLRGNKVIMVSGSDSHGTPITVQADEEGIPPRELFLRYHTRFLDSFTRLGVSFDLFTHTDTENHYRVSQDIFLRLLENGYLYREVQRQLYSEAEGKFLPDRYVIGTCPYCGFEHARGDQCDNCGKVLDALELINPRSRTDGSIPIVRETEHYFLDLPKLSPQLEAYLNENTKHWRPNVINFARGWLKEGLIGRPITRDLEWGVPVPLSGWESKRLYVWFEAVIGYLSASIEWARNTGQPEAWREWWYDPDARGYYFIGKDNIPFHAIIWPAMLIGVGPLYSDDPDARLNLPYDIPANEYLNLEGQKFSKSRNWYISLPEFLDRYDPDPLRYYLTVNAPETRDVDFTWAEFVRRNNDELVATWGNLAYRALTFAYRNFDGRVPQPGDLDEVDRAVLARVEAGFGPIGQLIATCKFQAAIRDAMALAQEGNRYLNEKAPWHQIKEDRQAAATTLFVALRVIDSLKTLFSPFLPFSSQELHASLGYQEPLFGSQATETFEEEARSHTALTYVGQHDEDRWRPSELPPGQPLGEPKALFKKLDESVIEEERARLGRPS